MAAKSNTTGYARTTAGLEPLAKLVVALPAGDSEERWSSELSAALEAVVTERFGKKALSTANQLRVPGADRGARSGADEPDDNAGEEDETSPREPSRGTGRKAFVRYGALIAHKNATKGPYSGMSFVIFPPSDGSPGVVTLCVGTNGLSPDEEILGRPGHARWVAALCALLRANGVAAWAKAAPVRTDEDLPGGKGAGAQNARALVAPRVAEKYGKWLYAVARPENAEQASLAITAFLDLYMEERLGGFSKELTARIAPLRSAAIASVFPELDEARLFSLLAARRFVIVEGPPGTGKTLLARHVLRNAFKGRGDIVQFHPGTTYESFMGGLAPVEGSGALGLSFAPKPGALLTAIRQAARNPEAPYLLVIDEINRADLAKVLGEAIFLFESSAEGRDRTVTLPHDFGPDFKDGVSLPANLHVLGTMNSSDRSIALLDLAIRRRFAFVKLWPQEKAVPDDTRPFFDDLRNIVVEHASDEALALMPGHSYFMGGRERLETDLRPLLEEYLAQGLVAGFESSVRAYLQQLERPRS